MTDLAPRVAVSAAVTALLGARVAATIGPIDALLRDPGGWLRRADALGTDGHLDGAKINALLETIAGALDLDATDGLGLPGGYLLSAAGTDPRRLSLTGTFGDAQVATITIDLAADLHQDGHVTPELRIEVTEAAFGLRILPLGDAQAAHLAIVLAPQPALILDAVGGAALAGAWLVPLVARFVLPLVQDLLDEPIWTGGPTARDILAGAGLIEPGPGTPQIAAALPPLPELGLGALAALANGATVALTPTLDLSAVAEGGRLGLRVRGTVPIDGDDVDVTVLFGRTLFGDGHGWLTAADEGVTAWVLRDAPGQVPPFAIDPGLSISGLGVDVGATRMRLSTGRSPWAGSPRCSSSTSSS